MPVPLLVGRQTTKRLAITALAAFVALGSAVANAQAAASYAVAASITVTGLAEGIAVSPDSSTAYVTHGNEEFGGLVSKIDTATRTVTQTLPVYGFPVGLAVSPDGSTLYMGNNSTDTLSVIDARTLAVRSILPICDGPLGTAITPDGSKVVVACQFDGNVVIVDVATSRVQTLQVAQGGYFLAVSPDSRTAYVTDYRDSNIAVVDLGTNQVTRRISTGSDTALAIDVAESGKTLFVTSSGFAGGQVQKIDIASGKADKLTLADQPAGLDVAQDDSVAYVVRNEAVDIIDTATLTVIDTVATPANGQLVAVAPNNAAAYATSQMSTVSVITDATTPPTTTPPIGPGAVSDSGSIFGS